MLTREEAQRLFLMIVNQEIQKHGEDYVYKKSPSKGKCSWTLADMKKAIENDEPLENNSNPIDDLLHYDKYLFSRGEDLKEHDYLEMYNTSRNINL